MIDLASAWRTAEDFLRRHTKSRAVREAEKRRQERRQREAVRKGKRAGTVGAITAVGTFGYAITVTPIAMAAVAAGGAAVAGMLLLQLLPGRRRARFSREELGALPVHAEDWLLDRRPDLPRAAAPALDAILIHLAELPHRLVRIQPNETLAWEARRLLGEHLPALVNAWCGLPAEVRRRDLDAQHRLVAGLDTVASQLETLVDLLSRDERMQLETRERFLQIRYGESPLSGR